MQEKIQLGFKTREDLSKERDNMKITKNAKNEKEKKRQTEER